MDVQIAEEHAPSEMLTQDRAARFSKAHQNQGRAQLYEHALRRGEGQLVESGALAVETGVHTGRSPQDRFVVQEASSQDEVWWGPVNQPLAEEDFERLHRRITDHLADREVFVQNLYACADPAYRLPVRVVTEQAWCALFARNLFIEPSPSDQGAPSEEAAGFTILHAPTLTADPDRENTRTETAIVVNLARRMILIAGTGYAGEIKKSIFGVLQYLLPRQGVATMHCSANAGADGSVALFFGLSGTGKTTLSVDPTRTLIGDDEHGWTDAGIFNFEGGSYAKTIGLSATAEPEIYAAAQRFGTVLENVVLDPETRHPRFDDDSQTENTRAAFPLSSLPHASPDGLGGHPVQIVMLTADAFGVLPPVARLTPDQAMYHYLSGYTSKLAGTERGVTEPETTFSACFGSPFLSLPPTRYAELLGERIRRHSPSVWLVNTGWSGGPYGVGERISIAHTRSIVRAILSGDLDAIPTETDPVFGVAVPTVVPGVPAELLRSRSTWDDAEAYDVQAQRLADAFVTNFTQFVGAVPASVVAAGPRTT